MTSTRLIVFAVTALCSVAGAVLGDGLRDKSLPEIAGYREWTPLPEKPIVVEDAFAAGGG
jgi:hypothetical protein